MDSVERTVKTCDVRGSGCKVICVASYLDILTPQSILLEPALGIRATYYYEYEGVSLYTYTPYVPSAVPVIKDVRAYGNNYVSASAHTAPFYCSYSHNTYFAYGCNSSECIYYSNKIADLYPALFFNETSVRLGTEECSAGISSTCACTNWVILKFTVVSLNIIHFVLQCYFYLR